MTRYILTRLALMVPTLFGVFVATFVLIQFVPGGPVEQAISELRLRLESTGHGGDLDAVQIEAIKKQYGFDKPPLERFWLTVSSFARFDFGTSFRSNGDVWTLIKSKLPISISLGLWSFLAAYLLAIPLGVAKAVREGSRFDALSSSAVLLGFALPGFVLGVVLIVLFSGGSFLEWFPLRGLTSDNWEELSWPARIVDYFWHLVLPLTCLTIGSFATLTMLTKNTFIEEIRKQYVMVARAKGLSERTVLYKHVFRNALLPLVTGLPAALVAAFFGGSLLIETLFSLDGLGLLSYESIVRRDYSVVLASVYLAALIGLGIKLLSDLLYVLVEPRVQFGQAAQRSCPSFGPAGCARWWRTRPPRRPARRCRAMLRRWLPQRRRCRQGSAPGDASSATASV
jgi:microcin C transport system permease protein